MAKGETLQISGNRHDGLTPWGTLKQESRIGASSGRGRRPEYVGDLLTEADWAELSSVRMETHGALQTATNSI